ncbi:MAG: hypothetical protein ABSC17_02210 [Thermacetogeniaceae bacterium]
MDTLSREQLKALVEGANGLCVSIFMSTRRGGAEAQQNPIRFKNLLRKAEEDLIAKGMRTPEARKMLNPAQKLLLDDFFWRRGEGIAVFLSLKMFHYYHLSFDPEELLVVSDRFCVKPLLRLGAHDEQFYILALSQNKVRLFQGNRQSTREVELEGVPRSLAEALKYDDFGKELQFHSGAAGGAAIFHSSDSFDAKDNILRYFRQINKGLHELVRDKKAPLLLAGVEYLFPIYKEANSYPYLLEEGIEGNPERMSAEELHRQGWAILKPYFSRAQQEAVSRYRQLAGTGLTSNDVKETVRAAYHGRADLLFVTAGLQPWGSFDPDTDEVYLHPTAESGDIDLLDFAAVHTILNGGTVYSVAAEQLPDNTPLATVFRY